MQDPVHDPLLSYWAFIAIHRFGNMSIYDNNYSIWDLARFLMGGGGKGGYGVCVWFVFLCLLVCYVLVNPIKIKLLFIRGVTTSFPPLHLLFLLVNRSRRNLESGWRYRWWPAVFDNPERCLEFLSWPVYRFHFRSWLQRSIWGWWGWGPKDKSPRNVGGLTPGGTWFSGHDDRIMHLVWFILWSQTVYAIVMGHLEDVDLTQYTTWHPSYVPF